MRFVVFVLCLSQLLLAEERYLSPSDIAVSESESILYLAYICDPWTYPHLVLAAAVELPTEFDMSAAVHVDNAYKRRVRAVIILIADSILVLIFAQGAVRLASVTRD